MGPCNGGHLYKTNDSIRNIRILITAIGGAILTGVGFAQTSDAPNTPDLLCSEPPSALSAADTLPDVYDKEGFVNLFDGSSFKGWWQSCKSGHSQSDVVRGCIWRVDPVQKAIYSTQRGQTGGILMSKRKFGNYEVEFDMWASFQNDGGFFNRTTATGRCYQTVLDYLTSGSVGGTWGEQDYGFRDMRPFAFGSNGSQINIPGNGGGDKGHWTQFTATLNPTSFGCPSTGCTGADWSKNWNANGYNQIRIKFYGGLTSSTKLTAESYFRKDATTPWIPIWKDVFNKVDVANYIGFQVHGGGSFGGARGNWYKNIRIRQLTDLGEPIMPPSKIIGLPGHNKAKARLVTSRGSHTALPPGLTIRDLQGRDLGSAAFSTGAAQPKSSYMPVFLLESDAPDLSGARETGTE